MVEKLGLPNEDYTSHEIRYLSPEFGTVAGYAVTAEITTNDPDSPKIEWIDFYEHMNDQGAPFFTVMKDVDSNPGSGRRIWRRDGKIVQTPWCGGRDTRWQRARLGGYSCRRVCPSGDGDAYPGTVFLT